MGPFVNDNFIADDDDAATAKTPSPTPQTGWYPYKCLINHFNCYNFTLKNDENHSNLATINLKVCLTVFSHRSPRSKHSFWDWLSRQMCKYPDVCLLAGIHVVNVWFSKSKYNHKIFLPFQNKGMDLKRVLHDYVVWIPLKDNFYAVWCYIRSTFVLHLLYILNWLIIIMWCNIKLWS